jgi:hypothetical protein
MHGCSVQPSTHSSGHEAFPVRSMQVTSARQCLLMSHTLDVQSPRYSCGASQAALSDYHCSCWAAQGHEQAPSTPQPATFV